jgi:hypothetical protein
MADNNSSPRLNYFLAAGQIIFHTGEPDSAPAIVTVNCVVMNKTGKFPLVMVGKVQQNLQMEFFRQLGDLAASTTVTNVAITNIMPLGVFTNEEFNARPEGMQLQEIDTNSVLMPQTMGNA